MEVVRVDVVAGDVAEHDRHLVRDVLVPRGGGREAAAAAGLVVEVVVLVELLRPGGDVVEDVRRVAGHRQRRADRPLAGLAGGIGAGERDAVLRECRGQSRVVQAGVLAGDELGRAERQAALLAELDVLRDLAGDGGRVDRVQVEVRERVVDPAEAAAILEQRRGELRVERGGRAVEGEVEPQAAGALPVGGTDDIGRRHDDGLGRVVVARRVRHGVPAVVAVERVIDVQRDSALTSHVLHRSTSST